MSANLIIVGINRKFNCGGKRDPLPYLSREAVILKMNWVHGETVMRTANGKDRVEPGGHESAGIGVVVRCVSAPDVESRIDRAMSILMAAAEEYAKLSREVTNPEEDPPHETRTDDMGRDKG